jgi:hypothetical protein
MQNCLSGKIIDIIAHIQYNRNNAARLSNIGRVNVSNTEDYIPGKGKIFFDIHFTAYHKKMNFITVTMIICKKSEVSPAAIQKTNLWKRKAVCMQMYKIT